MPSRLKSTHPSRSITQSPVRLAKLWNVDSALRVQGMGDDMLRGKEVGLSAVGACGVGHVCDHEIEEGKGPVL